MTQSSKSGTRRSAQKSKDQIRRLLKSQGPMEASVLAKELGVSAMAARQHLYQLEEQGLVEAQAVSNGVGRPAKHWQLTAKANDMFPDAHADLTVDLMGSLTAVFGDAGLDQLLERRAHEQAAAYGQRVSKGATLRERLEILAEIRSEDGYMAEVQETAEGLFFTENHCPICRAATACSRLCARELDVFCAVMGDGVEVERTEHILKGARRCVYKVSRSRQ
ncbi:MAG: transcriptional regulator [Alphaproteobacteria bacterium]|nr:MAG: transcriptional regulator [Alphaproteobacteria bacterium]